METFGWVLQQLYHAHLHFIGIICSKLHLDDLKTVKKVKFRIGLKSNCREHIKKCFSFR